MSHQRDLKVRDLKQAKKNLEHALQEYVQVRVDEFVEETGVSVESVQLDIQIRQAFGYPDKTHCFGVDVGLNL